MNVPRICTNPGCLFVLPPTRIPAADGPDREEETAKLQVIDAQRKCPKCNARLTWYIHHVWDKVKDNEDLLRTFKVTDKALMESKYKKFVEAREFTEAQLEKDVQKYKKAV